MPCGLEGLEYLAGIGQGAGVLVDVAPHQQVVHVGVYGHERRPAGPYLGLQRASQHQDYLLGPQQALVEGIEVLVFQGIFGHDDVVDEGVVEHRQKPFPGGAGDGIGEVGAAGARGGHGVSPGRRASA